MEETRQFRGISLRLAVQYLETLGGERVDGGAGDGSDSSDEPEDETGPVRVAGDGWTAELSATTVNPAGTFTLTEVTVDVEGAAEDLEPLVEAFARKAMRAGG